MAVDPRTPCLIGVGQRTWHLSGDEQAPEPLAMMAEVVCRAVADCDASSGEEALLAAVDDLRVVYCMSWPYDDLPGGWATRCACGPAVAATRASKRRHHAARRCSVRWRPRSGPVISTWP